MKNIQITLLGVTILLLHFTVASASVKVVTIDWQGEIVKSDSKNNRVPSLDFDGAYHDPERENLPLWTENIEPVRDDVSGVEVFNQVYEEVNGYYPFEAHLDTACSVSFNLSTVKKEFSVDVSLVPLRINPQSGKLERLTSFYLRVNYLGSQALSGGFRSYADHSVLSAGTWYKLGISEGNVYKIDYAFLRDQLGLNPESINPQSFGIFGGDGGMLPEENSDQRIDDLVELPLMINNVGNPNSFDASDYILFFAEGPNVWKFEGGDFNHYTNIYSDQSYVFLTIDQGQGKAIKSQSESGSVVTSNSNEYTDFYHFEEDLENLISSGREWFGQKLSPFSNSVSYPVSLPGLVSTKPIRIESSVAARGVGAPSSFNLETQSGQVLSHSLASVGAQYTDNYASRDVSVANFTPASNAFNLIYTFNASSTSSLGWIDYFSLNFRRELAYRNSPFRFRDPETIGLGEVTAFTISGASNLEIWDITDPTSPKRQAFTSQGNTAQFSISTEILREFIVFNPGQVSNYPIAHGSIVNQDLHAIGQPDMIIVSPDEFRPAAARLAAFHRADLEVEIVSPEEIYNEFNSGAQDISAIRDFMRMIYDKAGADPDQLPQYLLLFGDGSFDYKDKVEGNTNFVPTYQTVNSISPIASYTSDDYYGLLDASEGGSITDGDRLDVGIGRISTASLEEAEQIVDKILHYKKTSSFGDWRNLVAFVGDDEDNNLHVNSPEKMSRFINNNYPVYNIDKIYFDAYRQQNTSARDRYPDVEEAIIQRINSGALIMNYTGHGGINDWAHERVFSTDDIKKLENLDNLPVFVTATCDFSKYDDPANKTAGEYLLTNPNGGAIAMVTTVRLVYAYANDQLNNAFYDYAFEPLANGEMPRLGDIMVATKNSIPIESNNRKFTLLGDPALRIAYPEMEVVTTEINGGLPGNDTLSALSFVTVKGEVRDRSGNKLSNFNGLVYPTVYDKPDTLRTLKNDADSKYRDFPLQRSVLFKGISSVENGSFEFSFIVPKDINYKVGWGKISYYAEDTTTQVDAHGFTPCEIGGASDSAAIDNEGPLVRLFMNDTLWRAGGITDQNPILIAKLSDESGINTTGNGIGHDITAVLDGDEGGKLFLNNFYQAQLDNYKNGTVSYQLSNLSPGEHTIEVKAWDVHNNSGTGSTNFIVAESAALAIENLMNYPNPFTNSTTFSFEHNLSNSELNMVLRIFSSTGQLVSRLDAVVQSKGFRVDGITWETAGADLDNIGKGVYVYSLSIESPDGQRAQAFEKLVILR